MPLINLINHKVVKTRKSSPLRLCVFAVKKRYLRKSKTKIMKNLRLKLLIIGLFISIGHLIAQPPHPNFNSPPGCPPPHYCFSSPIDGGLSILLILSLTYGAGRIFQLKRKCG
jgi:hypothetical protein